jgi:hypothetical protein
MWGKLEAVRGTPEVGNFPSLQIVVGYILTYL